MKILQLCNKLPFPEKDGGAIAISTLTQGLITSGCEVKMLAMNTKKHFTPISNVPVKFREETRLEAVPMDTRVKARKALLSLLAKKSYNVSRFYSHDFKNKIVSILKEETFDIILLEGLYLTPYIGYIRRFSKAPVVLRAHNVEWLIWHRLAKEERFRLKRTYLNKLAKQLKEYESQAVNLCDGIMVFTETDKMKLAEMGCKTPVEVFPFGINLNNYLPAPAPETPSLFFIGALDWMPNVQGLEWFLKHAWNQIHTAFPGVTFHIAGRNMPGKWKNASIPGVVFHGQVEDAMEFMKKHSLMIVPLFAGSGIRIKIIEGMALQKPVISTGIGLEGIICVNGNDVMRADTYHEFFDAVKKCFDEEEYMNRIGHNARKTVEEHYNIGSISGGMIRFFSAMIESKQTQAKAAAAE